MVNGKGEMEQEMRGIAWMQDAERGKGIGRGFLVRAAGLVVSHGYRFKNHH